MPTYQYVCQKCEKEFEVFQSMNDKPLTVCPKDQCGMKTWGKGKVKRMIGAGAGLIFKGSGFYITDYRSKNYQEAASKDKSSASSSTPSTSSSNTSSSSSSTPSTSSGGASKPSTTKSSPKPTKT